MQLEAAQDLESSAQLLTGIAGVHLKQLRAGDILAGLRVQDVQQASGQLRDVLIDKWFPDTLVQACKGCDLPSASAMQSIMVGDIVGTSVSIAHLHDEVIADLP